MKLREWLDVKRSQYKFLAAPTAEEFRDLEIMTRMANALEFYAGDEFREVQVWNVDDNIKVDGGELAQDILNISPNDILDKYRR